MNILATPLSLAALAAHAALAVPATADDAGGGYLFATFKGEQVKAITMEAADRLAGPWAEVSGFSLAGLRGYEGPECYRLGPGPDGKPGAWCLLLDHYSRGAGYQPFVADDLASGHFAAGPGFNFPFRLRHGSILPVDVLEPVTPSPTPAPAH